MRTNLTAVALLLMLSATPAMAQQAGKTGVTMGYPGAVGFIWHASEKLAIRPQVDLSGGSNTSTLASGQSSESDSWSLGIGASVLFYVLERDQLRAYVSPRYMYAHSSTTGKSSTGPGTSESTVTGHEGSGSFGAQYSPVDRFSVFGEVGLSFSDRSGETNSSSNSGTAWGTRTAVGVIFYF